MARMLVHFISLRVRVRAVRSGRAHPFSWPRGAREGMARPHPGASRPHAFSFVSKFSHEILSMVILSSLLCRAAIRWDKTTGTLAEPPSSTERTLPCVPPSSLDGCSDKRKGRRCRTVRAADPRSMREVSERALCTISMVSPTTCAPSCMLRTVKGTLFPTGERRS